jgi:hypothetical protein
VNKLLAILLIAFPTLCFAQSQKIPSGASVYIEPLGGYETYLAAAFTEKYLPLVMVADRNKAEYVITSTVAQKDLAGTAGDTPLNGSSTGIAVIDLRASRIVFACAAASTGANQPQKTAKDCAKHLKKLIK